ncbi:MAG: acyl-CoA thioesterase-1 [Cyclobacteriaceae bacterium]|jgi:acyl-CoA thioesterase-1
MKKLIFICVLTVCLCDSSAQIKVACVGNSITYGSGIEGRDSLAYPPQLGKILGQGWEVANFGHSGATLLKNGNNPYWNLPEFDNVQKFQPDVLIIMLGTNDSKPVNWDPYKNEYAKDYLSMIQVFREMDSSPVIFICRPIPVVETKWGIDKQVVEQEIPLILKSISKSEKIKIIDLYKPMKNHLDLIPDKIHPNGAGSALMAEAVAKVLNKSKRKFQ